MDSAAWHTALEPKVQGTWNVHAALQAHSSKLDFYLLTSSISDSVGTATESNYCAANAFQDAFARYRRAQGLPAVSVGLGMISEVGYLAEHPEIEALLLRRGIRPLAEEDMLRVIDLALRDATAPLQRQVRRGPLDDYSDAHILTGLETNALSAHREQGFDGQSHIFHDPRCGLIAAAYNAAQGDETTHASTNAKGMPAEIAESVAGGATYYDALQTFVGRKISGLILQDDLDPERELGEFGFDSMLAAEFRTFVYNMFHVDVPFLLLLDEGVTVASLASIIVDRVDSSK